MRRNLFLHFLNRDSREIFGIYRFHDKDAHFRLLRRALNAAAILCEDFCIIPPGFIIEDEIAFNLAEAQLAYLRDRVLQFPIRESSLSDYAEKKRIEYFPLKNRYSGLFDDNRLDFLGRNAGGLIPRKSHIAEGIVSGWQAGADSRLKVWQPVKKLVAVSDIEIIRKIPFELAEQETAITWSAIQPHLPAATLQYASDLRDALQYTYFKQYCDEFALVVLTSIPHMIEEFYLPRNKSHDYQSFAAFLGVFGLYKFLLDSSAQTILLLRQKSSFIAFVDAYSQLAERCQTMTELKFYAGLAASASTFRWSDFSRRFVPFVDLPSDFELLELDHAFAELASILSSQNALERRRAPSIITRKPLTSRNGIIEVKRMPEIVLFVALQEELDVLSEHFRLNRNPTSPAASGRIGDTDIDVVCPKAMGRVPAAVEVTKYLESHKGTPPSLILVLGLAGGFEEEGTLQGHILCPTTVVDLAYRKVIDSEDKGSQSKFRRKDFNLDRSLREILTSDKFDSRKWIDEAISIARWPSDRRPSLHYGLITSVDEVVSSDAWRKTLLQHTEKLLGVEMEAGGVCAAAELYKIPVSMLRAVSDKADPAKSDDKWRYIGMKTVAVLLEHAPLDELLRIAKE